MHHNEQPLQKEDKEAAAARKKHNTVRPSDTAVASTSGAHKLAKKRLVESKRPSNGAMDVPCLYCGEKFANSRGGEMWIQCSTCKAWAHEACSGHENGEFVCEMCDE